MVLSDYNTFATFTHFCHTRGAGHPENHTSNLKFEVQHSSCLLGNDTLGGEENTLSLNKLRRDGDQPREKFDNTHFSNQTYV
jgi:hypothetical protein